MSDIEGNGCPIFKSVERCHHLLEYLLDILQKRISDQVASRGNVFEGRELILDYKLRLRLWAASVGVNADPLVGLDTRLRNRQNLQALVIQLLQLIETNLRRIIDFESPRQGLKSLVYIFKSRSGSSNLSPASGAALDAIQGGIEGLNHLAPATRQSGDTEHILHRGESTSTEDEYVLFERTMNLFVGGLLPKIHEALKVQLVASLVSRRRRILYQRRWHGEQSAQQQIPEESPPGITLSSRNLSAASSNGLLTLSENFGNVSTTSSATELYPQPPQPHAGTRICPWCSESLQDFNPNSPGWWKAHFWGDLKPYICISEECADLSHYFGSFQEWREYMESNHTCEWPQKVHSITTYYCDLCDSEFTDRRELGQHIGSAHPNQFTLQELTSMVERNVTTRSRDYGVCLLCNVNILLHPEGSKVVPQGKLNGNSNASDEVHVSSQLKSAADSHTGTPHQNLATITRHIASHLKSLALLSIRNIGDDTLSTGSGDSEKATFGTLDNMVKHQGGTTDNPRYRNRY